LEEENAMPRISELPVDSLSPALQALFPRYTSNGSHFAEHLFDMLLTLKQQQNMPFRYIELAIVVVSQLNRCLYCVENHNPRLQVEGLTIDDPQALIDGTTTSQLTDTDQLVVDYAIAVTQAAERIPEALFDRLRQVFTEAQIVELTLRISLCGFFNRFNQALQIGESSTAAHAV
jgi:uncharacterized peroxidase-related enzyme